MHKKHLGTYINDKAYLNPIKISYNAENLILQLPTGRTDNLVQIDSTNFQALYWNAKFKFTTDGRSNAKVLFQRNDSQPIEYKRIDD